MRPSSQLLRRILRISHGTDPEREDRCTTYVWFGPEDALKVRIALAKGVTEPMCPRCGATLCKESSRPLEPAGPVAAFLCEGCRRFAVVRLGRHTPDRAHD
jgi:hypothetical protein